MVSDFNPTVAGRKCGLPAPARENLCLLYSKESSGDTLMIIYVDIDDTLIRSAGTKRIPIPSVVQHVRDLKQAGAELYCWSSGGAAYACQSAEELGLHDCFVAFLPKPQVILDDQSVSEWRRCLYIHPTACQGQSLEDYRRQLDIA
jgi:hypothetical protein